MTKLTTLPCCFEMLTNPESNIAHEPWQSPSRRYISLDMAMQDFSRFLWQASRTTGAAHCEHVSCAVVGGLRVLHELRCWRMTENRQRPDRSQMQYACRSHRVHAAGAMVGVLLVLHELCRWQMTRQTMPGSFANAVRMWKPPCTCSWRRGRCASCSS